MKGARGKHIGQDWATFLKNHVDSTWACDFIQTYDLLFRQVYAFFIVHLGSRKVVYTAACRNPTQESTAQQLRNATMDGEAPKILLRKRDDKYGASFDDVAKGAGARVIKTAVRAPNMNSIAERFVGSSRQEMLDHVIVLDERHLGRLMGQYKDYFNGARPHQGIGQKIPARTPAAADTTKPSYPMPISWFSILRHGDIVTPVTVETELRPRVFLSYRRDDSFGYAGWINTALSEEFAVFFDVESIPLGTDFATYLNKNLSGCSCVLAIIGKSWLAASNESGQRRIDDPKDFVRGELSFALRHGIGVVPVLVDGASLPKPEDLPAEIGQLPGRQALTLSGSTAGDQLARLKRQIRSDHGARLQAEKRRLAAEAAERLRAFEVEQERLEAEAEKQRLAAEAAQHQAGGAEYPRDTSEFRHGQGHREGIAIALWLVVSALVYVVTHFWPAKGN
jgi:hypothetical protein